MKVRVLSCAEAEFAAAVDFYTIHLKRDPLRWQDRAAAAFGEDAVKT